MLIDHVRSSFAVMRMQPKRSMSYLMNRAIPLEIECVSFYRIAYFYSASDGRAAPFFGLVCASRWSTTRWRRLLGPVRANQTICCRGQTADRSGSRFSPSPIRRQIPENLRSRPGAMGVRRVMNDRFRDTEDAPAFARYGMICFGCEEGRLMSRLTISMPEQMNEWVEARINAGRYGNVSEYFRDLVRRDQERREAAIGELRAMLDRADMPSRTGRSNCWATGRTISCCARFRGSDPSMR
jgi:antitoxin ParD1/3/4